MVGEEEEDGSEARGQRQMLGNRRMFWRSASWSASRTAQQSSDCADQDKQNGGPFQRFPVPLTPRSQHNSKIRACLPPLQPLSIARRSLDEWPKAGSDDVGEWLQPPTPSGRKDSKPGQGLKLDVTSLQNSSDPAGSFVNRDRIAFFDKECSKVADHIYLGGDSVARNRDILRQNGITHVLNCVGFVCPEYFKSDLVYKTLWLQDSPSEDITSILYDVFDYFEDVREQGGRVLVHCCQGVSRSTSLVIAYLMWREGQSFDDAFQYVKAARRIANPNMGFACQLLQCQKRVHAIPLSPSSLLRMYRMAPHSPYDPLHLVPKMLNDPSPSALDSRGAFIVHVPHAIYVWIGKSCEPIMERDAKGAAFQVVRYERVQGPILTVEEGNESSEFWETFSNVTLSTDKSCNGAQVGEEQVESAVKIGPGTRKVDLYDVDFELFRKAISGGVVPPFSASDAGQETHLPARENNWSVLRRKFASGNMKELVSAPKTSLCRVYSDSMLLMDLDNCINKNLVLSEDSSTSCSPSYFSPSSLSSDSSTSTKSSESPSLSPTSLSCSLRPSVASSALSNSPLPSKKSNHLVLNKLGAPAGTNTPKVCSQTILSPSKRFAISIAERRGSLSPSLKLLSLKNDASLLSRKAGNESSASLSSELDYSIAERRGSLSPSLKLPSLKNDASLSFRKAGNESSASLAGDLDYLTNSNSRCPSKKLRNKDESPDTKDTTVREEGDVPREDHLLMCSQEPVSDRLSCDSDVIETHGELRRNCHLQEGTQVSVSRGLMSSGSDHCNGIQPLVRRWPGLDKVATFSPGDLDSNSAFLFSYPITGADQHKYRNLYLWMGKSFKHDSSQIQINNKRDIDRLEEADGSQIGCDIRTLMGLPKDIPIKMVKEEEEPSDFLEMLHSL